MYSSLAVLLHIGVIGIPLILSSHHQCPILTEYQSGCNWLKDHEICKLGHV